MHNKLVLPLNLVVLLLILSFPSCSKSSSGSGNGSVTEQFSEYSDPTNFYAISISYDQIELYWDDYTSQGEDGFEIERRTDATSYILIDKVPSNSSPFQDSYMISEGETYYYRIRSYNDSLEVYSQFVESEAVTTPLLISVPNDFTKIQEAIDAAGNRDTIIVGPGTYLENIDFNGKDISVRSSGGSKVTWIDGNQLGSVVSFKNGETPNSVLDGFTLTNGNGTFIPNLTCGGGIYCFNSSPTIKKNIISNNSVSNYGGGIYCYFNSSPIILNNTIRGNEASKGSGIYCEDNSNAIITRNTITENVADDGGGIYCDYCMLTIKKNIASKNTASSGGGGFNINWGSSASIIDNNDIFENNARYGGGILCVYDPTITNNKIYKNTSSHSGGGIYGSSSDSDISSNFIFDPGSTCIED